MSLADAVAVEDDHAGEGAGVVPVDLERRSDVGLQLGAEFLL